MEQPVADPQRREQARQYARVRRLLLLLDLGLTAALLVALLASGASLWLRVALGEALPPVLSNELGGHLAVVTGYVAALVLGAAVAFLPLSYYSGFVLPHRYGLSVQTRASWAADYVKGTLLGLVQGLLAGLPVYALLRAAPQTWWLWAALVLTLFAVLLTNLAPVLIVPLFYTLRPLEDAALRDRLVALAAAAGTRVRGVYVMDMSRRTRAANAALMGLGNTRRIVLGDTLWERFSPEEIEAVLAHELGHHVYQHLWKGVALEAGLVFLALWVADQALRRLVVPLGLENTADVAGLPLLLLIAGMLFTLLLPLTNGISRRWEAEADRFGMHATGNVAAWQGALRTLADQSLAEVDPPAWVEWLLYSHPSIRHRLEAAARAAT